MDYEQIKELYKLDLNLYGQKIAKKLMMQRSTEYIDIDFNKIKELYASDINTYGEKIAKRMMMQRATERKLKLQETKIKLQETQIKLEKEKETYTIPIRPYTLENMVKDAYYTQEQKEKEAYLKIQQDIKDKNFDDKCQIPQYLPYRAHQNTYEEVAKEDVKETGYFDWMSKNKESMINFLDVTDAIKKEYQFYARFPYDQYQLYSNKIDKPTYTPEGYLLDHSMSNKDVQVMYNDKIKEVVVSFRGTSLSSPTQLYADFKLALLGAKFLAETDFYSIITNIINKYKINRTDKYKIKMSSHSLGGSIQQALLLHTWENTPPEEWIQERFKPPYPIVGIYKYIDASYSFNSGYAPRDLYTRGKINPLKYPERASIIKKINNLYIVFGDPISNLLMFTGDNTGNLYSVPNKSWLYVINSHSLDNFISDEIFNISHKDIDKSEMGGKKKQQTIESSVNIPPIMDQTPVGMIEGIEEEIEIKKDVKQRRVHKNLTDEEVYQNKLAKAREQYAKDKLARTGLEVEQRQVRKEQAEKQKNESFKTPLGGYEPVRRAPIYKTVLRSADGATLKNPDGTLVMGESVLIRQDKIQDKSPKIAFSANLGTGTTVGVKLRKAKDVSFIGALGNETGKQKKERKGKDGELVVPIAGGILPKPAISNKPEMKEKPKPKSKSKIPKLLVKKIEYKL